MQLVKAPKPVVEYALLDPDQPVRVVTDAEFDWPDGKPRPSGNNNMGNFIWQEVRCYRRNYPYTIGEQAVETASGWNPKAFFNAQIMSQAGTNITARFVTLMETAANWTYSADANTLNGGGGTWDKSSNVEWTANYLAIKKSIFAAMKQVILNTNGMIPWKDWILIVSPGLAEAMAETGEIHDYLARQEQSYKVLEGENPDVAENWGLPRKLYGLKVVVEDAVQVKEPPNSTGTAATTNRVWCKSDHSAVICTRIGGINGNYGSPTASTFQRYFYKYDLAVEAFHEPKDKLYNSNVVDQFKEIISSPRAGCLITNTM